MEEEAGVVSENTEQQVETPPEKKEGWIPEVRFHEAIGKLKDELREERDARIRLEERQKAVAEKPKERFTAEQLQAFVDEGKISNAQMVGYLVEQAKSEATDEAEKRITEKFSEREKTVTIQSEMDRYKELMPETMQDGSDVRKQLQDEYRYLTRELGIKPGLGAELAAARAVLGPLSTLEKKVKNVTSEARETHAETGGQEPPQQPKAVKNLSAKEKSYYRSMIDKGIYGSWDDVAKVLKNKR